MHISRPYKVEQLKFLTQTPVAKLLWIDKINTVAMLLMIYTKKLIETTFKVMNITNFENNFIQDKVNNA